MNFTLQPSLERITLSKIAVLLWNCEFSSFPRTLLDAPILTLKDEMQIIEDRLLEKVPQVPLPQLLKQKLLCFIKPIGRRILYWIGYHRKHCRITGILPSDLCWTPQGTIDKKKTAELLIYNENLDITDRYLLACFYCLEDEIPGLWKRIPSNIRNTEDFIKPAFITFWTYSITGDLRTPSFSAMLEHSLFVANKTAVQYFLPKLTPSEKEELYARLLQTFPDYIVKCDVHHEKHYFFDVLCVLVSQMTEEQQDDFFRAPYSFIILRYFLDWPRQNFFMEMANRFLNYICNLGYHYLLKVILEKVIHGHRDYKYQQLFVEFWKKSSDALKSYIRRIECEQGVLLCRMFKIKDQTDNELILEVATLPGKQKIIYGSLLEFFVKECNISKIEMLKLKEKIVCTDEQQEKWLKFMEQFNDSSGANYKRNRTTENDNNSAKRLHCD